MKCDEFVRVYKGYQNMEDSLISSCFEHVTDCEGCRDVMTAVQLKLDGVDLDRYPCIHMAKYATFKCDTHENLIECDDAIILYSPRFDEYAINDPRPAKTPIRNCPWCGTKLPNKSDRWFKELESLGYDDPFDQDIPKKYKSDAWYRNS